MSNKGKKLIERKGLFLIGDEPVAKNRVQMGRYSKYKSREYRDAANGKPVYAIYRWYPKEGRFSRRVAGWTTADKFIEKIYRIYE